MYHIKKFSMKKIKKLKTSKIEKNHDDFLLDNLIEEFYTKKSPHLLITKTFCHIEDNSIILHHPMVENDNTRSCKILNKINSVGKNIKFNKKNKFINILPGTTRNNVIFFLVDNREMSHISKITLYTENGRD